MEVGKYVDITAANTDTDVFEVPKNKIAVIRLIEVRNPNAAAIRFRLWDKYTIDTTAKSEQKADYQVAAGDTIVVDVKDVKRVIGKLVAQSDTAGVQAYIGAELK